ncbi:hypothetical protein MAA_08879 [Metarhizium robertsii ARSEF 23]|uniref:Uncharacterized protein n=1 Tax=Metarhizium robertsii (strain ARSEF 23 / ATCC MYA-3075) TaxID=655844 RepID=E9F9D0_METRA|nr:uncharacterized protein MAA_08879 [Metarhizium robertsii ARSEF 23]EFY95583.1 hypothetical protein MAA_08879 [Metarhizium robertsii ARSEF 23]
MKQNQPTSSSRHRRTTRELPAWYRRLVILTITEDRDVEPWDFDEDISELGEDEGNESDGSDVECTCDDEDDCECYLSGDDEESEHSPKDAAQQQEERNSTREDESRKEQIVYAAYEAMLEAEKGGDSPRLVLYRD